MCLFDTPSFFFLILLVEVQTLLNSSNLLHSSIGATLVAAGTLEGRILDLAVELDLWLGTGRTDTDLRAILTEPLQHVRRSWHVNLTGRAIGILLLQRTEVLPYTNLRATQFRGRILTEVLHHLLDLVGTTLTRLHHIDGGLLRETILSVDVHQQVVECLALILSPCGNLTDKTDRGRSILVTYLVEWQEAETLLTTANILLLTLVDTDTVCNPLEASELVERARHCSSWQSVR